MKHSMTFDIFKIALPLAAAFSLLIACSASHPAPAAKAKPATTHASATTTAKAPSPTPPAPAATPAATPAAKAPTMTVNIPSNLLAKTKVPLIEALVKARLKVPGARPVSEELEQENGKLIYTFDLVAPNTPGVTEVNVDALSGAVLAVQHESASTEKHENKEESTASGKR